jgi:hypothetical protein
MIVVHIGLRKAGSTSIQTFLRDNEMALHGMGVDYPRIGRSKGSSHLNIAAEIRGLAKFAPSGGTVAELAGDWRESSSTVMVLSAEAFEECETEQARRLGAVRREPDEEVRIVLVIRDLVGLMPSSYSQMVKLGVKTHDFDAFFEKRIVGRRNDYYETARRWADAFGWNALRVPLLDPRHMLRGDLTDEFMSHADIDLADGCASLLKRPAAANVGPGWRVTEAIRALYSGRHGLAEDHPLAKAARLSRGEREIIGRKATELGQTLGWNDDRGRYLTHDQAKVCLELYAQAVSKLNETLSAKLPPPAGLDQRGFIAREAAPDVEQIPQRLLRSFYDDLAAICGLKG